MYVTVVCDYSCRIRLVRLGNVDSKHKRSEVHFGLYIINSIMGNGLLADVVGQIIQLDFSGELGVIE